MQEKKQGRTQQFTFKNGIPIVTHKGSVELTAEEIEALESYQAQSTSSPKARTPVLPPVVPAHVALDKKVLLFNAYFKQTVHESPQEYYRVRYVKVCMMRRLGPLLIRVLQLYYYLEDDSISVIEPIVENSGLPQGKLVNRQKIPKDNAGNTYSWTDLNIGQDIAIYARVFHIYDCNGWTKVGCCLSPPLFA